MFKEIFDDLINYNFDLEFNGRDLNNARVNEYLSLWGNTDFCNKYKSVIKLILSNTKYITFPVFKKKLFESVHTFLKKIGDKKFSIIVACEKYGSDLWILHLVYPHFKTLKNFVGFSTSNYLLDCDNFIIFDDCVYSGSHLNGIIDEYYDLIIKKNYGYLSKTKLHIIIPYMSNEYLEESKERQKTQKTQQNILFYNVEIISNHNLAKQVLKIFNIEADSGLTPFDQNRKLCRIMQKIGNANLGYPIYFDHKVANEFASFPSVYLYGVYYDNDNKMNFYGSLMNYPPSREMIDLLKTIYIYKYGISYETPCQKNSKN